MLSSNSLLSLVWSLMYFKNAWDRRADADRQRYADEMKTYIPPPGYDSKGNSLAGSFSNRARRSKADRDPSAPRKNISAYLFFQNEKRREFAAENPGMEFGELTRFTSRMYHSLPKEERKVWEEKAKQDKVRYESEKGKYIPPEGHDSNGWLLESSRALKQKRRKKDPNLPKRPRASYVFFTFDERPKIVKEFNDPPLKFTEIGHILGERWRELKPEERETFEERAEGDKLRYEREMKEYKKRSPLESSPPSPGDQVGFSSHNYYAEEHETAYTGEVDAFDEDDQANPAATALEDGDVEEGNDYEHHFNGAQE